MVDTVNPSLDPTTDKPPRPRRWIPISVRMLAVLLLLFAAVCVWLCVRGYRQLLVIREIERLNGVVFLDDEAGSQWLRDLVGKKKMRMFDDVYEIEFDGSEATDATLRQIRSCHKIT